MWFASILSQERARISYREMADGLLATNPNQTRGDVIGQISAHARPLTEWKLLSVTFDRPPEPEAPPQPAPQPNSRISRPTRIPLLPEPFVALTPKGQAIANLPRWRRLAFLAPRAVWWTSAPLRGRLKMPLQVAAFVAAVLRFGLQWETIHSAAVAIATATLAFLAGSLLTN